MKTSWRVIGTQVEVTQEVTTTARTPGSTRTKSMVFKCSEADFEKGLEAWGGGTGAMIQDAFPFLTADEREFLLTGMTAEEWDAQFGEQ